MPAALSRAGESSRLYTTTRRALLGIRSHRHHRIARVGREPGFAMDRAS